MPAQTEEGHHGGASHTTEPAAGSSSATDVSLREYLSLMVETLDRHLSDQILALRRETDSSNEDSERAIAVAKEEAKERLHAHNGLIEQMRQQATLFATRESLDHFKDERQATLEAYKDANDTRFGRIERFQAMLIGGMLLVSFIGVANLVKIWGA